MPRLRKEAESRQKHWANLHARGLTIGKARAEVARWTVEWLELRVRIDGKAPTQVQEQEFLYKLGASCNAMSSLMANTADCDYWCAAHLEVDHLLRYTKPRT